MSLPLSEIDLEQDGRREGARRGGVTPVPTPSVPKPLTPAEAAKQKTGRRAAVVLTDDTIAHGIGDEKSARGRKATARAASTSRTRACRADEGRLRVLGLGDQQRRRRGVRRLGHGRDRRQGRQDVLVRVRAARERHAGAGREVDVHGDRRRWKARPRRTATCPAGRSAFRSRRPATRSAPGGSAQKPEAGGRAEHPHRRPPPAPTLVPIPRSDVAPPAANAPIGNPASGVFIPRIGHAEGVAETAGHLTAPSRTLDVRGDPARRGPGVPPRDARGDADPRGLQRRGRRDRRRSAAPPRRGPALHARPHRLQDAGRRRPRRPRGGRRRPTPPSPSSS